MHVALPGQAPGLMEAEEDMRLFDSALHSSWTGEEGRGAGGVMTGRFGTLLPAGPQGMHDSGVRSQRN